MQYYFFLLQITHDIGVKHIHEYGIYGDMEKFYSDELYRIPSWDQIVTMFFTVYYRRKEIYDAAVKVSPSEYISADHTFKIGKNIGM